MSKSTFNALASLAILAAAPMAAQAEMTEMADTDLSAVNGQGLVTGFISGALGVADPFPIPGFTFVGQTLGAETAVQAGDAFDDGVGATVGFHLLPFTGPIAGLFGFNDQVLDNSDDFGRGVADIAFAGPFRVLGLADQGVNTALDFLFLPVSAPLDIAGNFFDALNDGVVGTSSRILTAPLNAVFGPVNRYVDGVTGRFEATVDGAAYAFTEVKGALIAGAFASASQGAANNGLDFTARVFGRISQAQAGLTNNRLSALADKYGY